jgi:hypothetical protein
VRSKEHEAKELMKKYENIKKKLHEIKKENIEKKEKFDNIDLVNQNLKKLIISMVIKKEENKLN